MSGRSAGADGIRREEQALTRNAFYDCASQFKEPQHVLVNLIDLTVARCTAVQNGTPTWHAAVMRARGFVELS